MALSESDKRIVRAAFSSDTSLGSFGRATLTLWCCASFFISDYFSEFIFLAFRYGPLRVYREHVRIIPTPPPHVNKTDPWILSNGDQISHADKFGIFPITMILWLVFIVAGYVVIKYISNKKKQSRLERALNDA